jgi:Meiotically up-regulated gene 113
MRGVPKKPLRIFAALLMTCARRIRAYQTSSSKEPIVADQGKAQRYTAQHSDGTPVLFDGKPVVVLPLHEVFTWAFDAQGNPKEFPPVERLQQYVYAIREGDTNNIKIGISNNVINRVAILQIGSSLSLSIVSIWSVDNPGRIERLLHKKLSRYRIHGEWFSLNKTSLQNLMDYMESIGAHNESCKQ